MALQRCYALCRYGARRRIGDSTCCPSIDPLILMSVLDEPGVKSEMLKVSPSFSSSLSPQLSYWLSARLRRQMMHPLDRKLSIPHSPALAVFLRNQTQNVTATRSDTRCSSFPLGLVVFLSVDLHTCTYPFDSHRSTYRLYNPSLCLFGSNGAWLPDCLA